MFGHDSRVIDVHYNVIKVYMFQKTLGGLISVEQDGDDYMRPNADLEMKPQVRGKEQLKCVYSGCLDGISEFKYFEYH